MPDLPNRLRSKSRRAGNARRTYATAQLRQRQGAQDRANLLNPSAQQCPQLIPIVRGDFNLQSRARHALSMRQNIPYGNVLYESLQAVRLLALDLIGRPFSRATGEPRGR